MPERHRPCLLTLIAVLGFACSEDEGTRRVPTAFDTGVTVTSDTGVEPDAGVVDCSNRPAEAPGLRSEASLVYDAPRNRLIMFGGNVAAVMCPAFSREPSNDVWAFELDCNNWRQLTPPLSPPARTRHAAAVDVGRDRMIIFGGRAGTPGDYRFLNDVWAFDLTTDTWAQVPVAGPTPQQRDDTVLVYDPAGDRMVLFGGDRDTSGTLGGRLGDTWSFSLQSEQWTQILGDVNPQARLLHGAARFNQFVLVFGGAENFLTYYNDLWLFDLTTDRWTELFSNSDAVAAPRFRFGPALFVDRVLVRALTFAGHDDLTLGNANDTWSWSLSNGGWAQISLGDTLNPAAREPRQCDFPADFTFVDLSVPDRRSAFPYTQSETHAYVFGGNTDCGRANDLWSFEFATNTWTELFAANGGISCPHTGQTNCANLCF